MGYCMNLREADFKLKAGKEKLALQAIKGMVEKVDTHGGGFSSGPDGVTHHYSWINTSDLVNAKTFKEAMDAWRWNVQYDKDNQIEDIWWEGEKLGDDCQLFDAIAPYVEEGSYIEMMGEDGSIWRWAFDGKKMIEQDAQITWN